MLFAILICHVFSRRVLLVDHERIHSVKLAKIEQEFEVIIVFVLLIIKLLHAEVEHEEAYLLAEAQQASRLIALLQVVHQGELCVLLAVAQLQNVTCLTTL